MHEAPPNHCAHVSRYWLHVAQSLARLPTPGPYFSAHRWRRYYWLRSGGATPKPTKSIVDAVQQEADQHGKVSAVSR